MRAAPDVLVAEDGRLVAFALPDHSLAVSRTRPSAFLVKDWQRALLADRIARPGNGLAGSNPGDPMPDDTGFRCEAGLCLARHLGFGIATAATQEAAAEACGRADLLVVSEPAAGRPCSGREVVITARDLARHGGAAITLRPGSVPRIGVRFAIAEPFRPWHLYRQFSRVARGLAARPQPNDLARGGADASRSPASAEDDDD